MVWLGERIYPQCDSKVIVTYLTRSWCLVLLCTNALTKASRSSGGIDFSRAQVPCAPNRSVHLIPLGLKCVADTVSQRGSTVGAAAGSGSRVCFSLASPKSPRCGQVGACCSFDFLGSVQQQVIILALGLLNQEHGAFAGYSHLL